MRQRAKMPSSYSDGTPSVYTTGQAVRRARLSARSELSITCESGAPSSVSRLRRRSAVPSVANRASRGRWCQRQRG